MSVTYAGDIQRKYLTTFLIHGVLIHHLPWFASTVFGNDIRQYESHVIIRYIKVTIVFNGYIKPSMKDDMKHRFLMKNSCVVVFIDKNSHVILTKNKLLSYSTNK